MVPSTPVKSSFPRYHQLRLTLAERIRDGVYNSSFSMPGERELAKEFGVGRVTVRTALARLEEEGLVMRLRGKGTLAVPHPEKPRPAAMRGGMLDDLLSMTLRTKVKMLERIWMPAPSNAAQALRVALGTRVLKVTRIRKFKTRPISYTQVYLPEDLAQGISKHSFNDNPIYVLLAEQGAEITSAEQTMGAASAEPAVATALGVPEGTALLKVTRVYMDATGRPVQFLIALFHPSHYEYRMRLSKVGGETKVWVESDQNN